MAALMEDDKEQRLYRSYTADCLCGIVSALGSKDLPLFSDMIQKKVQPKETPERVLAHVREIFSR